MTKEVEQEELTIPIDLLEKDPLTDSESKLFNALKGLGAPVRLVMLPKESHGYRAKESIMHMLWEQDQWLEKHVKNKK